MKSHSMTYSTVVQCIFARRHEVHSTNTHILHNAG